MAKRKYNRRSDDELIEDLERRIEIARRRQTWKEASEDPAIRAAVAALKGIDRALEEASGKRDRELRAALKACRAPLFELLDSRGLPAPRRTATTRRKKRS